MNRLTGGYLSNKTQTSGAKQVIAWNMNHGSPSDSIWKLELDPACNWTIMHHQTSLLLEQTKVPRGGGTEVACINKRYSPGVLNRSWIFTYVLTAIPLE